LPHIFYKLVDISILIAKFADMKPVTELDIDFAVA